jgi:tRNA/tmRNA/rRNA uracil-C5-methylase (TrmA/RlmC/RlmD family)
VTKSLLDDSLVNEILALSFIKRPQDFSFSTDSPFKTVTKLLQEASLFTDSPVKNIGKRLNDLGVFNDTLTKISNKVLQDLPILSDAPKYTFTTPKSDFFQTQDAINNAVNKKLSDVLNISSSGSLISQGYTVDNTYFLEDYVGESRTFT